jgi:hypothetical protein
MSGINTGKVVAGGLLAGVVYNAIDFLINGMLMREEFTANAARLGLDAASQEAPAVIATWVAVDFLFGLVVVFLYAAMRPRFGPGPKTAIYAGLVIWLIGAGLLLGFTQSGIFTMSIFSKMLIPTLVNSLAGAVAGAAVYKEA